MVKIEVCDDEGFSRHWLTFDSAEEAEAWLAENPRWVLSEWQD
jgi:hypothetical protein